jgi:hypothetical protein
MRFMHRQLGHGNLGSGPPPDGRAIDRFSKTRAARHERAGGPVGWPCAGAFSGFWSTLAQGFPAARWVRWFMAVTLCLARIAPVEAACPGLAWTIEPIGPQLWQVRGAAGEADAANRGRVSNLLLYREGGRTWLLGSGPSPASGRVLACQLRQQLGLRVTDVIAPWARPELVLGQRAFAGARRWAHADVAAAMRRQCAGCIERLRQRLGRAAQDLRPGDATWPDHLLRGEQGRLGPWRWWRLARAEGSVVTLWQLPDGTASAHGLLWADGPPDGRDADLQVLQQATARLPALAQPPATRWLPEQGPLLAADAPAAQVAYWQALQAAVDAAVARGEAYAGAAPPPLDLSPRWAQHPRHALNWQRAWRQAEDRAMGIAPTPR